MSAPVIHEHSVNSTFMPDHSSVPRGIRTLKMVSREAVQYTRRLMTLASRRHYFLSVRGKFLLLSCSCLMLLFLDQVGIIQSLPPFVAADPCQRSSFSV